MWPLCLLHVSSSLSFARNTLELLHYSCLRHSAGFVDAILSVCQLTVSKDINTVITPAAANIHNWRVILYANVSSHFCIINITIGQDITNETTIHLINSRFSIKIIPADVEPAAFLNPISFTRQSKVNKTRPNNPTHEMKRDITEIHVIIFSVLFSISYIF